MPETPTEQRPRRRLDTSSPVVWAAAALLVLLVFNAVVNPGFFALRIQDGHLFGSPVDVLKNVAPTLLIAVGMTLVIATRGIDLSVGAVLAISGRSASRSSTAPRTPRRPAPPPSPSAPPSSSAWCSGPGTASWCRRRHPADHRHPGAHDRRRGLAMLVTDGQIITAENPAFDWLGGGFVLGLPAQVVLTLLVLLVVAALTRRTALGTLIEAVGTNPEAARLAGVRSRSITWTVYVFVAFTAAVAGLMTNANVSAADANRAGLFIELDAILAVVIGGTSLAGGRYSLTGTVLGALILQTLTTTTLTMGLPDEYVRLFKAVVIIAVFLLQAPRIRAALARRRRPARATASSAVPGPPTTGDDVRPLTPADTAEPGPDRAASSSASPSSTTDQGALR